jgi:glycosyltransferase involved in cell wall biosynthesis
MKILYIAPFPPPITGNSLAVDVFKNYLINFHCIDCIDLSKKSYKSGIISFSRISEIFKIFRQVFFKNKSSDVIYFSISQSFAGNLRDLLIFILCYRSLPKMIIHLHGGEGMRVILLEKHGLINKLNKWFLSHIKSVIILGQSHYEIYSKILPPHKINIVPNFAEDFLFTSENEIKNRFNNVKIIRFLFLSNFISSKGYLELLEAFFKLPDIYKSKISIDFAGDFNSTDSKKDFLERIANFEHITYHGLAKGEKKKSLFHNSHIFCLPTYYKYEGQPISILEAYASGCFVVTTNHGGICDIFSDEINGIEVKKRSVESIAQAMMQIIDDPEILLNVALHNYREATKKFRTSIYNNELKKLIENV